MAQLAVFLAGLLLTTVSQASDVAEAEADPSAVQGFLSKYMTAPTQRTWTSNHGPAADEGTGPLMVIDDKPVQGAIREEEKAAQKLLPNGNNTPMTLYAFGAGLFALVMMLRVHMRRGLRPATVLASNDNILEMKSCVSDDLKWDPLNLLPSDPTTGLQPAVFAVSVEDKLKEIVAEQLGVEQSSITPEASFASDLGADSLDVVEMVMKIEEEFNIELPDERAEQVQNLSDAVRVVTEVQGAVMFLSPTRPVSVSRVRARFSVEDKLKEIVAEQLGVEKSSITPEASFASDLGADSLDVVEMVMKIEEEFNVEMPDEKAEEVQNLSDAVRVVTELTA